ncbi:MAG: NAD(P)/FAD-dependent oxidoreductase [Clostridia bacterium]
MNKKEKIVYSIRSINPSIMVMERNDGVCCISGIVDDWNDAIKAGNIAYYSGLYSGVVNDIKLNGFIEAKMRLPYIADNAYDGLSCDVLVIGGGIIGCATIRELSKLDLKIILVEKENDLALHASSRNDGVVHVGIDIKKGQKKLDYVKRSNPMFDKLCEDLDVDFKRTGQYLLFKEGKLRFLLPFLRIRSNSHKIGKFHYYNKKKLLKLQPNIADNVKFGINFYEAGIVCPYMLTIALAENASQNGAQVLLNTAVTKMRVNNGIIESVFTNRGTIKPKIVINAAGAFSDKIADMAEDRFFTIHPRKGTSFITDKETTSTIINAQMAIYGDIKSDQKAHTKGGGLVPTVDGNILVGPNALEVPYREDTSVDISDVNAVFDKHKVTAKGLSKSDIITYFSGIRACAYGEDFIVEKGRKTKNIIHIAGIQSPGLTAAPAIAEDAVAMTKDELALFGKTVTMKSNFNPIRTGVVKLAKLNLTERDEYIKNNPAYGEIVCRCEEISKGEIIDALHSTIMPQTVDGLKRRVRVGMGRCQGGFCQPKVLEIIHDELNIPYNEIAKKGNGKIIF